MTDLDHAAQAAADRDKRDLHLTTPRRRDRARQAGGDVPKLRPGVPPKPFASFVEQTEGCWLWRGTVLPNGYGEYNNGGRHSAHRWAWIEAHGPIPPGLQVCHACDTKRCVRVAHLFLGTQADNMRDKVQKHRQIRGEQHGQAKLTLAQVQEIRRTPLSAAALARRYGVHPSTIRLIRNGRNWRAAGSTAATD